MIGIQLGKWGKSGLRAGLNDRQARIIGGGHLWGGCLNPIFNLAAAMHMIYQKSTQNSPTTSDFLPTKMLFLTCFMFV
jgi:hypothetical protein